MRPGCIRCICTGMPSGCWTSRGALRDTVLLEPRRRSEIAFVADNPGEWMLQRHILEHQVAGMMATVQAG